MLAGERWLWIEKSSLTQNALKSHIRATYSTVDIFFRHLQSLITRRESPTLLFGGRRLKRACQPCAGPGGGCGGALLCDLLHFSSRGMFFPRDANNQITRGYGLHRVGHDIQEMVRFFYPYPPEGLFCLARVRLSWASSPHIASRISI
ncbi:uncharacterized protein H6S33_002845 [Morchella sextelata]|uniref:uncharacterized protein n=1 Tax=Morchella sextelata TaxID=1174677 RepID=UPI001D0560FD|nr:uncharacterized protein H6S33_002845 [Morchella sextelata]KAH0607811.1 hypothetical protein H6S33_002845 [Morchella sextelata]